jgi:hypothetical protein
MTNTINQILVQNASTFETISRLTVWVDEGQSISDRIDQYFSKNDKWGIVSLEDDPMEEFLAILLVASAEGPDFMMDLETGEMEAVVAVSAPVENIFADDSTITFDIDEPVVVAPIAFTAPKTTVATVARAKKATGKQYEILSTYISANPGVTRTVVFSDASLLAQLRTPAAVALLATGDKVETKRWNRRLNFLIRDMRRGGVDIRIERQGGSACYTILGGEAKELPFSKPVPRSPVESVKVIEEELAPASLIVVDTKRSDEPQDVMMNFDDLLSQLDDDEATITSDDQIAFKAAREMIK